MDKKYYLTFSGNHEHPDSGVKLKGYYIEVHAPSRERALDLVRDMFGDEYNMLYPAQSFEPTQYEYGLYEIIRFDDYDVAI